MSIFVISGDDPATVVRRKLVQLHAKREGWLATVVDAGRTTCRADMLRYMEGLAHPASTWRVYRLEDVATALGISNAQAAALAARTRATGMRLCMFEVMAMHREWAGVREEPA